MIEHKKGARFTGSKKAPETVSQSDFRSLFENSVDSMLLTKPDGAILSANPAACRMFGMSEEEIRRVGRAGLIVLDEKAKRAIKEREKVGKAEAELTLRRKDGSTFEGEVTSKLFTDSKGTVKTSMIIRDITERKKTEKALRESEERLNLAQKIGHVGCWEYYTKKDKAFWSDEMFNIFGLKPQLYGPEVTTYVKLVHPDDREKLNTTMERLLFKSKAGDKTSFDYRILRPDGSIRIIHTERMTRDIDQNGTATRIMGVDQDITERKKAEEKLKESEALYRTLFENSDDGFILLEPKFDETGNAYDFRFLKVNRAFERQTGIKATAVEGKMAKKVVPDLEQEWISLIDKVVKSGKLVRYESYNAHTNKWYATRYFPRTKNQIGILFRDITKRKKVEQNLIKKQHELKTILNSSPTLIFYKDKDGKIIQANKALAEAHNISRKSLLGKTVFDLFSVKIAQTMAKDDSEVMESKRPKLGIIETYETPTGKRWIRTDKIPSFDENGEVTGVIGFSEDITERKLLEKQVKDSERLAAIGQTAGMVGHDIRNPLQSMIGTVYLLKSELIEMPEFKLKGGVAESLDELEHNIDYINKIVSDLQDYSKLLKPQVSSVNLHDVIAGALKSISIPNDVKLSINVVKGLTLTTDPEFIRRALTNLVINAVQAMPNGGKLGIAGFRKNAEVWISVSDTGVGISKEVKPKLFTPMVTTKAKGQGLGLAVVKRLIKALDGNISFESEKGKGTKFMIKLPTQRFQEDPSLPFQKSLTH